MPPKKNLTKKKLFFKKTLIFRAINSIGAQCKENNNLLNCGKKTPYKAYESRRHIAKFK